MLRLLIFFLIIVKIVYCAEIISSPVSRNVTLNSTIKFTCRGIGDWITFYVDEKLASKSDIMNRGFQLLSTSTENGTVTRSLMATAYEENNNTNITCGIIPSSPIVTSHSAVLLIQGILDGVGDLMATVLNGSSVSLTWTPPYSLDNVPITGYNIITSDGINITVNTPYHILTSSDPDPCNITTVSVGAINDVGTSQYNNVSFYYQRAPHEFIFNGEISLKDSQLLLKLCINITNLCIGEHPNEIDSVAIAPNGNITNFTIYSQHQQVNEYLPILPIEWDTFIVNITLINRAGKSRKMIKFGSFININSSVINCSTISVSWERPSVSDGVNIHNYTLLIYDDISHTLVDRVSVNGSVTSYQFEDDDLFHHRYTYVIYGNNELGQGNYSNMTFSYQRVPKSTKDNTTFIITSSSNNKIFLYFMIPIVLECTGEAPENISIEITCDNTMIYNQTHPVEYANHPMNITGNISVELTQHYQRCSLSIVFSNSAGHSEPVILNQVTIESPSPLLFLLTLVLVPIIFFIILVSCLPFCKFTNRCCFAKDNPTATTTDNSTATTTDNPTATTTDNPTATTTDNPTATTTDNPTATTTDNPTSTITTTDTEESYNFTTTTEDYYEAPTDATSPSLAKNAEYEIPHWQPQYTDKITSTTYTESDTTSALDRPLLSK